MKKLILLVALIVASELVHGQILPNAKATFSNIDLYTVNVNKQRKSTLKLTSSDLANSRADISTSEDGRYTYFTFFSSILGGESVMTVESATKSQENGITVYTAQCKSLMHDTESTWIFYYKNDELITVCDYLPSGKNWIIKFINH